LNLYASKLKGSKTAIGMDWEYKEIVFTTGVITLLFWG
jgi:hypothetical protein